MNESTGTELDRFGIKWQGARNPICVPMSDGYWTPWHVAQEHIRKLQSDREAGHRDYQSLRDHADDLLRELAREKECISTLEVLVEVAYREGFIDGYDDDARPQDVDSGWVRSDVRKRLEK